MAQDLVRRIAQAEGVTDELLGDRPEDWWAERGHGELRYDTLLEAMQLTDAARQAVLREYFEPDPERPSFSLGAHLSLAELCRERRISVILTTNFDQLMERALRQIGVSFQLISSSQACAGMEPLRHAQCTVIKLHGDYTTLGQRHTPAELREYPPAWRKLLREVFNEYGLLVVGWSATHDKALIDAWINARSRRYPTYWAAHRGHLTEEAERCITWRRAVQINVNSAEEFLADLRVRLARLETIAARAIRPRSVSTPMYSPNSSGAPAGWAWNPFLQLRTVTLVGPATVDECGRIRVEQRSTLETALRMARITGEIRALGATTTPISSDGSSEASGNAIGQWERTPGAFDSGSACNYRLGGDASSGVSALLTIRTPNMSQGSTNALVATLDIGISVAEKVSLDRVARVYVLSLMFLTSELPAAFADILPANADTRYVEVHALANMTDGHNQARNDNRLDYRIDASSLGATSQDVYNWRFGAHIGGSLNELSAGELVVQALEEMALDSGFVPERWRINAMRGSLGLPFLS